MRGSVQPFGQHTPYFDQTVFSGFLTLSHDLHGLVELDPCEALQVGLIRTSAEIALKLPSSYWRAWIEFMMMSKRLGKPLSFET